MYESFYALNCRPFSATPDAGCCFLDAGNFRQTFDELVGCVVGGQGIGVLTAPAGLGKTLLCQKLVERLEGDFQPVLLSNGNFPTRRSLLQAILYELGHPYNQMVEQELRLALTTAVKEIGRTREAVAIIIDEAHLLNDRLLEEIRTLTNLVENGKPLVRIVLAGQIALDEKLAEPAFDSFNQRICSQAALEPFTRQESANYIAHRLQWAGGDADAIFSPEAIEYICHAGDGSPRCLNQLCDHSLLLAYVVEAKTVGVEIVREALEDLKQLPLHWNEPTENGHRSEPLSGVELQWGGNSEPTRAADRADVQVEGVPTAGAGDVAFVPTGASYETEDGYDSSVRAGDAGAWKVATDAHGDGDSYPGLDECSKLECLEVGAEQPAAEDLVTEHESIEVGYDMDTEKQISNNGQTLPGVVAGFVEEAVFDRYALLDAGKELPVALLTECPTASRSRSAESPVDPESPAPSPQPATEPDSACEAASVTSAHEQNETPLAEPSDPESEPRGDRHNEARDNEARDDNAARLNETFDDEPTLACETELIVGSTGEILTSGEWVGGLATADCENQWPNPGADEALAMVDEDTCDSPTEDAQMSDAPIAWENSTVDLDACSQLAATTAERSELDDEFEEQFGVQALQICSETQQALLEMAARSDSDRLLHSERPETGESSEHWDDPIAGSWPDDRYDVVQPETESPSTEGPRPQPRGRTESLALEPAPREVYRGPHRRSLGRLFSELRRRQREES